MTGIGRRPCAAPNRRLLGFVAENPHARARNVETGAERRSCQDGAVLTKMGGER